MNHRDTIDHAARHIREKLGIIQARTWGLVLGSGLTPVAEAIARAVDIPYADIPGLPEPTVDGHGGFLRAGILGDRPVLALCGRSHLYEGHTPQEVCLPVRVLGALGVEALVLTNAAGALNPRFEAGALMLITDHINMTGQNPLTGPNIAAFGPRFPDMSQAWCPHLLDSARRAALALGLGVERGVYIQIPGPSLETPAETRAYRQLGADAIGMSTVLEAIAARHMGLRLLGISCLTNKNTPDSMAAISHAGVLRAAGRAAADMARLLEATAAKGNDAGWTATE
ncbi:MAG: purine-nucleoside phosphorylase [Desulfovibrionaceae bacterium CG1_02_65_16]|nr:MAG: purine-nucleoside phosphorylase [Desulfovibrionaceae bacterium CG1_02_65_16]